VIGIEHVLHEVRVPIAFDRDIVTARQRGRLLAKQFGFQSSDATLIAAVISELARNMLRFAAQGEIMLRVIEYQLKQGIEVVAVDEGPGIPDVFLAIQGGYSTSGGLGLGLAGARRLMDDFEISSRVDTGTIVTSRKWKA
jgi:serine/threonine-protein kinase RsbT